MFTMSGVLARLLIYRKSLEISNLAELFAAEIRRNDRHHNIFPVEKINSKSAGKTEGHIFEHARHIFHSNWQLTLFFHSMPLKYEQNIA